MSGQSKDAKAKHSAPHPAGAQKAPGPEKKSASAGHKDTPAKPAGKKDDRRTGPRFKYQATVKVAPWSGTPRPPATAFREVDCHDLSQGGLSYWSKEVPNGEFVVFRLGRAPRVIYAKAKIVNWQPGEHDDIPMVRVGCEFVERL